MRRRFLDRTERGDPMSLFMDPIMDFIGLMFFMVVFLLVAVRPGAPLRYVPIDPPVCPRGLPYLFTVPVQGGVGNRTFSDPTGSLDALGLKLDADSGTIYGIVRNVPAGESRAVELLVRDQASGLAVVNLTLKVGSFSYPFTREDANVRLLLQAGELPPAREGVPYEGVIGFTGGLGKVRWSTAGLPASLTMDNGRVIGMPTRAGVHRVTVKGEFDNGIRGIAGSTLTWESAAATRQYTLQVLPALVARNEGLRVRAGEALSGSMFSSPLRPGETVAVTGLPEDVRLDPNGVLVGTPTKPGSYPIVFRVMAGSRQVAAGRAAFVVLPSRPTPAAPSVTARHRAKEQEITAATAEPPAPARTRERPAVDPRAAPSTLMRSTLLWSASGFVVGSLCGVLGTQAWRRRSLRGEAPQHRR